eukprot:6661800-Pyramimonas_sp.AAC.1
MKGHHLPPGYFNYLQTPPLSPLTPTSIALKSAPSRPLHDRTIRTTGLRWPQQSTTYSEHEPVTRVDSNTSTVTRRQ